MRVVEIRGAWDLAIKEVPRPALTPGQARLRVRRVGICGSDMHFVEGESFLVKYPITPGHEFSGDVIETTPGSSFQCGDRVVVCPTLGCGECPACRRGNTYHCPEGTLIGVFAPGALADEIVVPETRLRRLPEGMTYDQAAMVEPVAVAIHMNRRVGVGPGTSVLVLGTGSIGLLAIQEAKQLGAGPIVAVDRVGSRLDLARDTFGADAVFQAGRDDIVTGALQIANGFDVIFEMVGRKPTLKQAVQLAKPGGIVVWMVPPAERTIELYIAEFFRKELSLRTARLYSDQEFDEAIEAVASRRFVLGPLATHHFPLSQTLQGLQLLHSHPEQAIKVLIDSEP